MKAVANIGVLLALVGLMLAPPAWAQQRASIAGTITDADDGVALIGANVLLVGTTFGSATDINGRYSITGVAPGTYVLRVSYIGYQETETTVTLAAGENRTLDLTISQAGFDLNTVVVTASRRQEKALDAPASISVLSAQDVSQDVGTSSVAALRNTTGVDMAQTGIDRRELVLRGFNNAFSGATYVLTDYRQAAVPSLGVNIYSIMPNINIDIDRVEVVRGPGSALYGAGVDAGVVHFVTKDPFQHPGTTISISGGERSLFGIQARHAGVVGNQFGYKVTGVYSQANDFELDPNEPQDAGQIAIDGPRNNDYEKLNLNGTLEFRPSQGVSIIANGGFSQLKASVLSGIGTVQADGFGYSYGQLRLQVQNFFAQVYVNQNAAGDSFVYDAVSPTPVIDKGALYNAQAQYDLTLGDAQQLIFGVDLELTRPDTEGTILGRNEDNDSISEYGAYVQSTTTITSQLDLTLALRGDYNNIVESFQLSPRAAVVFKPAPGHSMRATYNRSFSSPGTNSLFLDIVAAQTSGITVRGRGAGQGFNWERNAAFRDIAGTDLVMSSLLGCFPQTTPVCGAPSPAGLPLDVIYGQVYGGLAGLGAPTILALLQQQGLFQGFPQDVALGTVQNLIALLDPNVTPVNGFSRGLLAKPSLSGGAPEIVADLADIDPLDQTTTQTFEVGYKGVFNNKVLFAIDGYYTSRENFVGPLAMETAVVLAPSLLGDLTTALAGGISNNVILAAALQQLDAANPNVSLTPESVAGIIVGLAGGQLPSGSTPVGIVQAAQNNPGVGQVPELMLSYRNFGQVKFWGVDASVQVQANENLNLFGNVSVVSDNFFDNTELEETNTDLAIALNAPTLKLKLGAGYTATSGLTANISGRYTEGFPVRSGPYVGDVDSYFLLDLGAGYDFDAQIPGLRFDVGISNVLNNEHYEFVGAPKIGRVGIARLTYTIK